jgi:hypothetical protein
MALLKEGREAYMYIHIGESTNDFLHVQYMDGSLSNRTVTGTMTRYSNADKKLHCRASRQVRNLNDNAILAALSICRMFFKYVSRRLVIKLLYESVFK